MIIKSKCSFCESNLQEIVDLGLSPPANNFIDNINDDIKSYPLIIDFCNSCFSIQLRHCLAKEELYSFYTYSTPNSITLSDHYTLLKKKLEKFNKINNSLSCLEIGSNNGNLLKFLQPNFDKVLGVDPAKNIAQIAKKQGIDTLVDFFSQDLALQIVNEHQKFNVIIARHMFAHNENPLNLLQAIQSALEDNGVFIIENAYALDTFINGEFDQIYHEHMFYYSAINLQALLSKFSCELIDYEHVDIHGGSGVFICANKGKYPVSEAVTKVILNEEALLKDGVLFKKFNQKIKNLKSKTLNFLNEQKKYGNIIGSYGAPAKAFTVFSYFGITNDHISFCVDTTPTKIGKVFPVSRIPIISEEQLSDMKYDTIIVNACNYKNEILEKASSIFARGTKLVFLIPEFESYTVE